ncbi:DNA-directed RNA polymerase III subunit RPC9-like [Sycon ciliatum]|uniref:DNA-directed RNA polymerase III subunit RPC9-like n=1 Tax=Sycon ciliatum TaxID=27933 RepID=UPI0020ACE960|eukprot:scpid88800/ scgid6443/ DNA-directed RNA polymerase III subunit RPC9
MEVVDDQAAMLSNYEVYSILKDAKQSKKHSHQNVATIVYETSSYLEKTPCGKQSEEAVTKFLQALREFKLTKLEKLQLLNHRPTSQVELHFLIAESEERFGDEELQKILEIVESTLDAPDSE